MKILIVSDTHGHEENLRKVLEKVGTPDCMIHLGDSECGEHGIRQLSTCPMHLVAGNCDFFCELPKTKIVELQGLKMLLTHGHYYYVSVGTRDIRAAAKANGCSIAMFGHTHRPFVDQSEPGLTVLNPGSLSYPRQEDHRPSYILMQAEEGSEPTYEICYL